MPKTALAASLTLCAFRAGAFDAQGGSLPTRLVVAPWGTHDVRSRGRCVVNETTLAVFAANQVAMKLDGEIALDFDHNTVPGTPSFASSSEPRKVAAFGVPVIERDVGIVLTNLRWTPEGKDALAGGHYRDLSPAVFRREDGTVYAIHSAGVCRHGEIDGLTIEAAAASAQLAPFFAALSAAYSPAPSLPLSKSPTPPPMKPTATLITLLAGLGVTLAMDADEAGVETALKDAIGKMKKPDAEADAMSADLTKVTAQLTTLSAEVSKLTSERDSLARKDLIRQAQAEGKVIPLSAEVLEVTPLNVLTEIVKQAKPGEVPLGKKTVEAELKTKGEPDAFTADQAAVFAKMGLTKEDYEKYGKPAV